MDYAKSGDPEIGVVIKRCEWVEGTEIGYQRSDIGVGTGSNKVVVNLVEQQGKEGAVTTTFCKSMGE